MDSNTRGKLHMRNTHKKYNGIRQLGAELAANWNELVRNENNLPIAPTPDTDTGEIKFGSISVVALNLLDKYYSKCFDKPMTLHYVSQKKEVILSYDLAVELHKIHNPQLQNKKKHPHKIATTPQQPALTSQPTLVQNRRSPPSSPPTKTQEQPISKTKSNTVHTRVKAPPKPQPETPSPELALVHQLKAEIDRKYSEIKTWGQSFTQTIFCGLIGSGIVPNHIKQLKAVLDTVDDNRDSAGTYRFEEIVRILTHANPYKHRARRSENTIHFYQHWHQECQKIKQAANSALQASYV